MIVRYDSVIHRLERMSVTDEIATVKSHVCRSIKKALTSIVLVIWLKAGLDSYGAKHQ